MHTFGVGLILPIRLRRARGRVLQREATGRLRRLCDNPGEGGWGRVPIGPGTGVQIHEELGQCYSPSEISFDRELYMTICNITVTFVMNILPTAVFRTHQPTHRSSVLGIPTLRTMAIIFGLASLLSITALIAQPAPAAAAQASQVIVRAHGNAGTEQMALRVNGEEVSRWTVSTDASDYVFNAPEVIEVETVEVLFLNDQGSTRDLVVDYVDVGGIVLQSEDQTTISTGTFVSGQGCVERASISETLHCAGSFTYAVPASTGVVGSPQPTASNLEVRVFGTTGSEQVTVVINGSDVLSEVIDQGWQILRGELPDNTTITDAEVHFVNDDGPRDVRVDYLEVDGERFESESSSTRAIGTWVNDSCSPGGPSDSEWLRCNGSFRYDVNGTAAVVDPVARSAPPRLPETNSTTTTSPSPTAPSTPTAPSRTTPTSTTSVPAPDANANVDVRIFGATGSEQVTVAINDTNVISQVLALGWQNLTHTLPEDTSISSAEVSFVNGSNRRADVRVDYIELNGQLFQSESPSTRAIGTWVGGRCFAGGPSDSEWLRCPGSFDYDVTGTGDVLIPLPATTTSTTIPAATPAPTSTTVPASTTAPVTSTTAPVTTTTAAPAEVDGLVRWLEAPVPGNVAYEGVSLDEWAEISRQRERFNDPNDCQSRIDSLAVVPDAIISAGDTAALDRALDDGARVIVLEGGTYNISNTVWLNAGQTLIGERGEQVIINAAAVNRGVYLGEGSALVNTTVVDARNEGVVLTSRNLVYRTSVGRTGYGPAVNDSGAGVSISGGNNNCVVSVEAFDGYNEDGAGCGPCTLGGNADGFTAKFGAVDNTFIDAHAYRNSDDGFDFWMGGTSYVYFGSAFDGGRIVNRPSGDGNGYKLGRGEATHYLYEAYAYDNIANGFDINGNSLDAVLVSTDARDNGGDDYVGTANE